MLPRVAAITMAFDEAVFLPIWARHYARQVGADACYVIDHGSAELPPLPPGLNVLRLPRSPQDDPRRADFISRLTTSLLTYYDWVLYTDVDELVLADPQLAPNLLAFCVNADVGTISAVGLDVQHVPAMEPPLDPASPVGLQRAWVRFTSAMCKPVLTRTPIIWSPGFHHADRPPHFGPLYLFHLRWADYDLGLQRLAKTRSMAWASEEHGAHQRVDDRTWSIVFEAMAGLPRREPVPFDPDQPPIRPWLQRMLDSGSKRDGAAHAFDLHVNAAELWPIPPHFRSRL